MFNSPDNFLTNRSVKLLPIYQELQEKYGERFTINNEAFDWQGRIIEDYIAIHSTDKYGDMSDFWEAFQDLKAIKGL